MLLSDAQQGRLNPKAVNCLRRLQGNAIVWGARTRAGVDGAVGEWKYIPVRRLALFVERSVGRSLAWVSFEDNDERLWAAVRLEISRFLDILFRLAAFQGRTTREAFFVKCDASTMTQNDIDNGRLVIIIGFAPLKPSEFVTLTIRQFAGRPGEI